MRKVWYHQIWIQNCLGFIVSDLMYVSKYVYFCCMNIYQFLCTIDFIEISALGIYYLYLLIIKTIRGKVISEIILTLCLSLSFSCNKVFKWQFFFSKKEFEWNHHRLSENFIILNKKSCHLTTRKKKSNHKFHALESVQDLNFRLASEIYI